MRHKFSDKVRFNQLHMGGSMGTGYDGLNGTELLSGIQTFITLIRFDILFD